MFLTAPEDQRLAATACREAAATRTRTAMRAATAVMAEADPAASAVRLVTLLAQADRLDALAADLEGSARTYEEATTKAEALLAADLPAPGPGIPVSDLTAGAPAPELTEQQIADGLEDDDPIAVAAALARTVANIDAALAEGAVAAGRLDAALAPTAVKA